MSDSGSTEYYELLVNDVAALQQRVDAIEDQLTALEQIQDRITELDARTDLMQLVDTSDDLDGEERSTRLLQHMQRKADTNNLSRIALTHSQAVEALHYPDLDRTTIYTDLRRCARLIGDRDLCWYESADQGSIDQAAVVLDYDAFRAAATTGDVDPAVLVSTGSNGGA